MIFLVFYGAVWFVDGIDRLPFRIDNFPIRAMPSLPSSRVPSGVQDEGFQAGHDWSGLTPPLVSRLLSSRTRLRACGDCGSGIDGSLPESETIETRGGAREIPGSTWHGECSW